MKFQFFRKFLLPLHILAWTLPLLELLLVLGLKTFRGDPNTGFCFVGGLTNVLTFVAVPVVVKVTAGVILLAMGIQGAMEVNSIHPFELWEHVSLAVQTVQYLIASYKYTVMCICIENLCQNYQKV